MFRSTAFVLVVYTSTALSVYKLNTVITHEHVSFECYDNECITSYKNYHLRRNVKTYTANLTFKRNMNDCYANVTSYMFLSNEYKITPLQFGLPCSEVATYDVMGFNKIFSEDCKPPIPPIKKNVQYTIKDSLPSSNKFPPKFPLGRYKMMADVNHGNKGKRVLRIIWMFKAEEVSMKA